MTDNPLITWIPGTKLEPMQYRYLFQELLRLFPSVPELAAVVKQELGIELNTVAKGDLNNQLFEFMIWAESHGKIEEIVSWTVVEVKGKVETAIESSVALRRESERMRDDFNTGVITEQFVAMAKRLVVMHAELEVLYAQGAESHKLLHLEILNLLTEHEKLLVAAVDNAG
ncbi:MAG: hypothetical protein RI947_628 [Candidatus Parcubacteria bacterium]|jgi:hypothetical protein